MIEIDGKELRGDLIHSAILRNDAIPVPATLEAIIRVDDSIKDKLAEGKIIKAGLAKDSFRIIKSVYANDRVSQAGHLMEAVKITALLESCHPIAFVRDKPLIKEKSTLAELYRAAGAKLKAIDADFAVDRFACYTGESPSFHIARAIQENGGIVRWKKNAMKYFRLNDLFRQKPSFTLPINASYDVQNGFGEHHKVQTFYSIDEHGAFIYGNKEKARNARFMPNLNEQQLRNLTSALIHKKTAKIAYNETLCAGDLIDIAGDKPLVVVTAAHVFKSGTDGAGNEQYTQLWLYELSN